MLHDFRLSATSVKGPGSVLDTACHLQHWTTSMRWKVRAVRWTEIPGSVARCPDRYPQPLSGPERVGQSR